jgi:heme/copper-type cytochrome/quinol oxidase subunit 2
MPSQLRLIRRSESLVLFRRRNYFLVITRDDVLHSWAVPSLGVKLDVVPGRLDLLVLRFPVGSFFGFCSELCGAGHRIIPILALARGGR